LLHAAWENINLDSGPVASALGLPRQFQVPLTMLASGRNTHTHEFQGQFIVRRGTSNYQQWKRSRNIRGRRYGNSSRLIGANKGDIFIVAGKAQKLWKWSVYCRSIISCDKAGISVTHQDTAVQPFLFENSNR